MGLLPCDGRNHWGRLIPWDRQVGIAGTHDIVGAHRIVVSRGAAIAPWAHKRSQVAPPPAAAPQGRVSSSDVFATAVGVGAAACFANSRRRAARAGRRTQPESRLTRLAYPLGGASRLRLMLDTADLEEWERYLPLGFFHGITSNPVLMHRAGWPVSMDTIRTLYAKAFTYPGIQEILFQTWGDDAQAMYERACEIRAIDPQRIGVKIPLTTEGMKVTLVWGADHGCVSKSVVQLGGRPGFAELFQRAAHRAELSNWQPLRCRKESTS